jgi:hypothetical protein
LEQLHHRLTAQTLTWFRDLHKRNLLQLDPPYQRRSVWNQGYRDTFIDTVLLGYPCPPIFLHESISSSGVATYSVIDGKQRLTTVFDFADGLFPVSESSVIAGAQGTSFGDLTDDLKKGFWTYQFGVEYLPSVEEGVLTDIFSRLNKNVAKLTRQELRHARYSGKFARAAESAADAMAEQLPRGFPRIAEPSRRQMKDIEFAAQLLLLIEHGPRSLSQDDLDAAYSDRDEDWEHQRQVERGFRRLLADCEQIARARSEQVVATRLRNQADFYGFVGALHLKTGEMGVDDAEHMSDGLVAFMSKVDDEKARANDKVASAYYQAARSASNDLSRREVRINTLLHVLGSS